MIEKESIETQSVGTPSDSDKIKGQVPYNIVSQAVEKIKNEPFLFVIAIVALLIGLFVSAVKLGSPDLRFITVVVSLLAFVVILGYYILMGLMEKWKHVERLQKVTPSQFVTKETTDTKEPATRPKYGIKVKDSTVAIGDKSKVEVKQYQKAVGPPSTHDTPSAEDFRSQNQTTLELQLSRHQRNLTRLQAKKSVYAVGEEPLSLINQIEAEEREIQRIQKEMEQLSKG